jgi:NADP-dependent 3-hydroxy acid dehydrogenase YdfG
MPQCPRCRDVGWVDVNLFGPVLGVRPLLPGMLVSEVAGVIVNVGSKQGITNPPGHPIYKNDQGSEITARSNASRQG